MDEGDDESDNERDLSIIFPGALKILNVALGYTMQVLEGHALAVTSVAFSGDGLWLVSGSFDHTAKIWDVTTGRLKHRLRGHRGPVLSVAFATHGRRVATGSADGTVAIWDVTTGRNMQRLLGHASGVMSVAWSTDGTWIASGGEDKTIKLWDTTQDYRCAHTVLGPEQVTSVAFGPWSDWVASVSASGQIRVWNIDLGLTTLTMDAMPLSSIAVSPTDGSIVSSSSGRYRPVVQVWDPFSGACLASLEGHKEGVTSAQFSADGGCIISGSDELRMWETATGHCLWVHDFHGEKNCIKSVSVSPDSSIIAMGCGNVWVAA